jgi:hypothetical protein
MYCSSCGLEVSPELNYCNRCGANLNPSSALVPQVVAPPIRMTGPTIALAVMVVCSIAAIFSGASTLAMRGVHPAAIAWMVIIGLTTVFGITGLIIRFWTALLRNSLPGAVQQYQRPAQLRQPQSNPQLQAQQTGPVQQPIASVTDHTTRTFDPVYRERTQRGK